MDRRQFLGRTLALGCSAAAFPLVTPVVLAAAPWDARLVVVILRGAMDGLAVIEPQGDRDWAGLRPVLGTGAGTRPLANGFFARAAALERLDPLWDAGELAFVHAVSTPYRDRRSHFDGQDILEAGTPGLPAAAARDGWLNRMLQAVPGVVAETAYAIGRERLLILSGQAPVSSWSPDARLRLSPQAELLLERVYHEDPLFREASAGAIGIAAEVAGAEREGMGAGLRGDHVRLAEFAVSRLREETRIASFSIGGWDTHARQDRPLAQALDRLSDVILTLRAGLGPVWEKTAVLCLTEFGRTVRENGTAGTDHGTGGAAILAGGAVRGGRVVADWPGLGEGDLYAGRDLMPTRDVRSHAGWVMRALFGLDRGVLEGSVFPGMELGGDPGLIL